MHEHDDDEPVLKLLTGQSEHADATAPLYVPAWQVAQTEAPANAAVPGVQGVHTSESLAPLLA